MIYKKEKVSMKIHPQKPSQTNDQITWFKNRSYYGNYQEFL